MTFIDLDAMATTPIDPRVLEAMLPFMGAGEGAVYGNPSSRQHLQGRLAAQAVARARQLLAESLGVEARDLFFTSGATESINWVFQSVFHRAKLEGRCPRFVVSAQDHPAVRKTAEALGAYGAEVTVLIPLKSGHLDREVYQAALSQAPDLVSLTHINSELGLIEEIAELADLARQYGVCVHVDAAQSLGKLPVSPLEWGVDFLSLSGHKCYGPKGVGALYVRHDMHAKMLPLLYGGSQEEGLRSGTLPVHQVVGMGHAASLAEALREEECSRIQRLATLFREQLTQAVSACCSNQESSDHVPHNINIYFPGVSAQTLMSLMPEVGASAGTACQSASFRGSHILALIAPERALGSLRFSLGRMMDEAKVLQAVGFIERAYGRCRGSIMSFP